jgi:hypothetical protein
MRHPRDKKIPQFRRGISEYGKWEMPTVETNIKHEYEVRSDPLFLESRDAHQCFTLKVHSGGGGEA